MTLAVCSQVGAVLTPVAITLWAVPTHVESAC
jgi:hypothetical protein